MALPPGLPLVAVFAVASVAAGCQLDGRALLGPPATATVDSVDADAPAVAGPPPPVTPDAAALPTPPLAPGRDAAADAALAPASAPDVATGPRLDAPATTAAPDAPAPTFFADTNASAPSATDARISPASPEVARPSDTALPRPQVDASVAPPRTDVAPPDPPRPEPGDTIVEDDFSAGPRGQDLSLLVPWSEQPAGVSAFEVGTHQSRRAIFLTEDALEHPTYNTEDGLKTYAALDYRFPKIVQHRQARLRIELDVAWEQTNAAGESGRLTVIVLHDYPPRAPRADDTGKREGHPFGRPAYTLRLLSGPRGSGTGQPLIQYGGGTDPAGTFDFLDGKWWLPGFLSAAGGGLPGMGDPFPAGGWIRAEKAVAAVEWQRFAFVIEPDRATLVPGDSTAVELPLPDAESRAPLYRHFDRLEGVRLAWRGVQQVYVANLKISTLMGR